MPEYLHPGVYVEEVDAGPKPIEGVSTSTAGAASHTAPRGRNRERKVGRSAPMVRSGVAVMKISRC